MSNDKELNDNAFLLPATTVNRIKAEGIREAVSCCDGDKELLEYADKLEGK